MARCDQPIFHFWFAPNKSVLLSINVSLVIFFYRLLYYINNSVLFFWMCIIVRLAAGNGGIMVTISMTCVLLKTTNFNQNYIIVCKNLITCDSSVECEPFSTAIIEVLEIFSSKSFLCAIFCQRYTFNSNWYSIHNYSNQLLLSWILYCIVCSLNRPRIKWNGGFELNLNTCMNPQSLQSR